MAEVYKSRVYTDRPPYADFDPPEKFEAIKSIIAKRLIEHPKRKPKNTVSYHLRISIQKNNRLKNSDGKNKIILNTAIIAEMKGKVKF